MRHIAILLILFAAGCRLGWRCHLVARQINAAPVETSPPVGPERDCASSFDEQPPVCSGPTGARLRNGMTPRQL